MAKARARRPLREYSSLDFPVQAPNGHVVNVRAFQAGLDREGRMRWTFYYLSGRRLMAIPVGPMLDAARARLDDMIAAEEAQWAELARLQAISAGAKQWRRFVWLRTREKTLTDGYRKLIPTWVPRIGGRLWWVRKEKPAPAAEVQHAA